MKVGKYQIGRFHAIIRKVLFCKLNDAPVVTLNDAITV